MSAKRNRYDLFFEILCSLQEELGEYDRPSPTRISRKANMPYDRFQKAIEELVKLGMVARAGDALSLTEKRTEFVIEYRKVNDFLQRMGLLG